MRLVQSALSASTTPEDGLLLLEHRARRHGIPGPAALSGEWFGAWAVLAPSVSITPQDTAGAFATPAELPVVRGGDSAAIGGGWFGYLSYDSIDPSGRRSALPLAGWGWADHVLRLDRHGQWWFEALVPDDAPDPDDLAAELTALFEQDPPSRCWTATTPTPPSADRHRANVQAGIRAIASGDVLQANICTRFTAEFAGSSSALFAEGVQRLRPNKAAYLAGDWGGLVSMSPELFLTRSGGSIRSSPIKGTVPRRGPQDDPLAGQLRRSAKDVAENVLVTDLVRNDFGRICATGSVRVPELLTVHPAPGVWHLHSSVTGVLAPGCTDAELLRAVFPPASVTGAPKRAALDLIAELETAPRGGYTGAMGLVSPLAGLELNVAVRTIEIHGSGLSIGVGGGITADSDPGAEWQECLHKVAPLEHLLATPPQVRQENDHTTGNPLGASDHGV